MFVVGDSYTTLFLALGAAVAVAVLFGGAENYEKGIQDWSFLFTCYAIGMVAGYLIFPKIFEKTNSFIAMIPVYLARIVGLLVFLYTKNDVLFNLMGIPYGATLLSCMLS